MKLFKKIVLAHLHNVIAHLDVIAHLQHFQRLI